jgi:hypothetical protein
MLSIAVAWRPQLLGRWAPLWRQSRHQELSVDEQAVEGIHTTIPLHRWIFNRDFLEGRSDPTWVESVLISGRAEGAED